MWIASPSLMTMVNVECAWSVRGDGNFFVVCVCVFFAAWNCCWSSERIYLPASSIPIRDRYEFVIVYCVICFAVNEILTQQPTRKWKYLLIPTVISHIHFHNTRQFIFFSLSPSPSIWQLTLWHGKFTHTTQHTPRTLSNVEIQKIRIECTYTYQFIILHYHNNVTCKTSLNNASIIIRQNNCDLSRLCSCDGGSWSASISLNDNLHTPNA